MTSVISSTLLVCLLRREMLLRKATPYKIQSSDPLKGYHIFDIKASTFKGGIIDAIKRTSKKLPLFLVTFISLELS